MDVSLQTEKKKITRPYHHLASKFPIQRIMLKQQIIYYIVPPSFPNH